MIERGGGKEYEQLTPPTQEGGKDKEEGQKGDI